MPDAIYDFAVIGAGMAGASLAAELAPHARVLVLEAEDAPGYHSTGRSAAFWDECYGGPGVVPLTLASGQFLREGGFLTPRGAVHLARDEDLSALDRFTETFAETGVTIERLKRSELSEKVPRLRGEWRHGLWEPACADIDVAGLHQHYLKVLKRQGGDLICCARAVKIERPPVSDYWEITLQSGETHKTAKVINAAGAWADPIARLAGARPIGIEPKRRTIVQLRVLPSPPEDLPLVLDINGGFYFKPDAGRLWLSPHDEVTSEACDAAPEEIDVARAIDRFETVVDWEIEHVERRWAGLRSFAPDRLPVYGYDPQVEGFYWFAGQGGFGIQTAPAAARLAAQELLAIDADEMTADLSRVRYSPQRFVTIHA